MEATQTLPVSERFPLGVSGAYTRDTRLKALSYVPIENLTKSVLESVSELNLIDEYNLDWIRTFIRLNREEMKTYNKGLMDTETDRLFKKVNARIAELRGKREWPKGLNEEDIAAILLFTEENATDSFVSIYNVVNEPLITRHRYGIEQAGPYIINLLLALRKLGPYKGGGRPLYKGVNCRLDKLSVTPICDLSWPGFTSTTDDENVAKRFTMWGFDVPDGGCYIFEIRGNFHGYDISKVTGSDEKGKTQHNTYYSKRLLI